MENKELLVSLYDGCQYHCTFCMYGYVKETQPLSKKATMSEQHWYDLFQAAYGRGFRELNIGGRGEPTLHPKFTRIVAKAYKLGYKIYLLTNGLNDKSVIKVLPLVHKLKININGVDEHVMDEIHKPSPGFSFDRCIASVKNIVKAIPLKNPNIILHTNYVVTTQSLEGAFTFPEKVNNLLSSELGARKLFIYYQHFHNYVKTSMEHLGFDCEGMQEVLVRARAHSQQKFLLDNTNLLAFIQETELLIKRLQLLSDKPGGDSKNSCYTCEAHKRTLFVDGNGDCYGCYAPFRAVNGLPIDKDPFFFGNLLSQSFEEVVAKGGEFDPIMDVSKIYWRPCLSCVAKGPIEV